MPVSKDGPQDAPPGAGPAWLRRLLAWVSKGASQAPLCPS